VTTDADLWAPFALVVRCGPLELRAISDDDIPTTEISPAAFTDNPASLAVSRKVGYVDNGTFRVQRRRANSRSAASCC
jgi:RimJ/RimL family protein N-acetyltransferase